MRPRMAAVERQPRRHNPSVGRARRDLRDTNALKFVFGK
jgi:hypothetical protein